MYSTGQLQSINSDLLYEKYLNKIITLAFYNGRLTYIDTANRMLYYIDGQAVLQFRH